MQTATATNGTHKMRQSDFPGFVIPKDNETPAPRLKATVTITITDHETGEKFTKVIPGEFYRGKEVTPWVIAAVHHDRTQRDMDAFLLDRNVTGAD